MRQRIIERERRRQGIKERRIQKRRQMIKQNLILLGGLILTAFLLSEVVEWVLGNKTQGNIVAVNQKISIETKINNQQEGNNKVMTKMQEELDEGNLILVNDQYPIREYSDENMVSIGDYLIGICKIKSTEIKLQEEVVRALREMLIDFKEEMGESDLTIISGYRDFNTQERLHYQSLAKQQETGKVLVARPDRSEHHTGLAVDFGLYYEDGTSEEYDGTGIYSWINENCYKYGFIMRYDEEKEALTGIHYEPWHFRYVGKAHAQIMYELDLCLEEYIEFIKGYTHYTNPGQGITKSSQNYSIYYVPCEGKFTNIPLPTSKDYTLSGNNKDGFIVTVSLINKKYGN